jgi:phospholipid/cholesterol/gamma-HCH transport system substrate-binding protein
MITSRNARIGLAVVLALALIAGVVVAVRSVSKVGRTHAVAYFDNSNGLFAGDEVRILGVPVGKIDSIEALPNRVKITFWFDDQYKAPADAKAAILSQQLITSRAIQLTPAYTSGPAMTDGAVIPEDRTAVPVEWDDLREQLQKLTDTLQPTKPGGVSTLGSFIDTSADNLRGQGANIRDTVIKMSQAFSALGDHSNDIFSTIKNLSIVVSALQSSEDLMKQFNRDLASVTALLVDDPNEVGRAVSDLRGVVDEAKTFIAENRESLGTTSDRLASISTTVADSLDDIKQALHVAPNAFQNLINIYQPAQAALTGALVVNNFANPITFLCGAIQAASRMGFQQSAKLCAQYLAPIIKNRQYNFPPLGENLFVGTSARPNEVTYSEDWMRPDYIPPPAPTAAPAAGPVPAPPAGPAPAPPADAGPPLPAEAPVSTNPDAGLEGMMVPPGGGQ